MQISHHLSLSQNLGGIATWVSGSETGATQNRVFGPAAAAALINPREMQSLRSPPRPRTKTSRLRMCAAGAQPSVFLPALTRRLKLTQASALSSHLRTLSSRQWECKSWLANELKEKRANKPVSVLFCPLYSLYEVNTDVCMSQSCYF